MRLGNGKKVGMALDTSYSHVVAVVLTPEKKALLIDSNNTRPPIVQDCLRQFVESLGFRYVVVDLPSINQVDTNAMRAVFRTHLGVESAVTIGGYCATLALCHVVDVLCTSRYDEQHLLRFLKDVMPPTLSRFQQQTSVVLYARTVANDCVRMCMRRMTQGYIPVPTEWPPSISPTNDCATVKVSLRDVLRYA